MSRPFRPRTELATHAVSNQSEPLVDVNLFAADAMLSEAALRNGAGPHRAHLTAFGARVGSEEVIDWGRQANENPPKLKAFDRFGRRIDEVEFHPAYHALMDLGLSSGVSSLAWTAPEGGHAAHAALMMLAGMADAGSCCPFSMTYAVVPALRAADWTGEWIAGVTAGAYDGAMRPPGEKAGLTMGMAMTEKQGGSDVRANETRAHALGPDEVDLVGHKWFCSAPMSDAFLTLAYEEAGLSCFLVPRWRPDGTRNPIEIQRLKDKLGDRSNASSEIEYRGAWARRVGEPGRGVRTIIGMVHHTRLDCLAGSAGAIRQAVAHAVWHCDRRTVFQKKLVDQPLMRAVLADLALEAEGALALAFRIARAFDASAGDPAEAAFARIATPVAKYWVCKRTPAVVYEAMETHGGAGYVEEHPLPRLFRQSPLNAIWEGSGNVIALDVLRALAREPAALEALSAEFARAHGAYAALDAEAEALLAMPLNGLGESGARGFAERLALALTAAALIEAGLDAAADGFVTRRIADRTLTFGAGQGEIDESGLIERARLA